MVGAIIAGAGIMGGLSLLSGIGSAKAAAKEADRRRKAEMVSAQQKYAATEASVNLMKAAGREAAYNASLEVLRAEGVQSRDIEDEIQRTTSTVQAQSEGLTSGRSKGREMLEVQIKGRQALEKSEQQGADMISKITTAQDKQSNDLNNKLLSAHQELTSVLSTPGQIYQQNVAGLIGSTISSGIQGAALGASLGGSLGAASTSTTSNTSGLKSLGIEGGPYSVFPK
jgi:hypothetical protein